jgi:hypothetical protein
MLCTVLGIISQNNDISYIFYCVYMSGSGEWRNILRVISKIAVTSHFVKLCEKGKIS